MSKQIDQIHALNLAFSAVEQKMTHEVSILKQREQELVAQLYALQQKNEQDKAEQARNDDERAAELRQAYAQREQSLVSEVHAAQQELASVLRQMAAQSEHVAAQLLEAQQRAEYEKSEQLRQHREQERVLIEQANDTQQKLQDALRTLCRREQDVGAQLLELMEKAARETAEQMKIHREQERALNLKHTERERILIEQLQKAREDIGSLEKQSVQREKEIADQTVRAQQDLENLLRQMAEQLEQVAAQLLEAQQRAEYEKYEQLRQHHEQERLLHEKHAERELSLVRELQATQEALRELERNWSKQEQAYNSEIHGLQSQAQDARHARELQAQQHEVELRARQEAYNRLVQENAVVEAKLRDQILAEKQAASELQRALAEAQQVLSEANAPRVWPTAKLIRNLVTNLVSARDRNVQPDNGPNAQQIHTAKQKTDEISLKNTQHNPIEIIVNTTNDIKPGAPHVATTLDDLMVSCDLEFVESAYRTVLARSPDPEGRQYYLSRLRAGVSKVQILAQLCLSTEGRASLRKVPGLAKAIRRYQIGRMPLVGAIFRLLNGLEGDGPSERKLRSLENHVLLLRAESSRRFTQMESVLVKLSHIEPALTQLNRIELALSELAKLEKKLATSSRVEAIPAKVVQAVPSPIEQIRADLSRVMSLSAIDD
ncbi:MAG TPA: DUF4214 domain-containing protein [Noviherbaspirillum sp.]|nr:DUF4214 domain-containing protein [Noviherbaspirillum sp.]